MVTVSGMSTDYLHALVSAVHGLLTNNYDALCSWRSNLQYLHFQSNTDFMIIMNWTIEIALFSENLHYYDT